jgi:NTP pyrophosphatase (non-canonical NTP hydrolase)
MNLTLNDLNRLVVEWANARNLIHPDNAKSQFIKVVEEVGELGSAILKADDDGIIDALGDVMVTIIILNEQLGYSPAYTLGEAYKQIANRKGKTVGGTFIKE